MQHLSLNQFKAHLSNLDLNVYPQNYQSDICSELTSILNNGGKRFRPALMMLFGNVYNIQSDLLIPYARAIEMVHTASLIHDDVIDQSSMRRKKPTLHNLKNSTSAILGGDFLLAQVMNELTRNNHPELVLDLTNSICELADGEWLQFNLLKSHHQNLDQWKIIARKKTASLMMWCERVAYYFSDKRSAKLGLEIAQNLGIYFQMIDDLLDTLPQKDKPSFIDITNGLFNFVFLQMFEFDPSSRDIIIEKKFSRDSWNKDLLIKGQEITRDKIRFLEAQLKSQFNHLLSLYNKNSQSIEHITFLKMLTKLQEPIL